MGDGWLYWLLIAAFTLSNSLLLIVQPQLINSQFQGLLIGGIILSLSIFPQIIDWRIDYTAKMGQQIRGDVLASSIFQGQQPIGLYSHRGHAAIVLALTAVTAMVGWFWRFTSTKLTAITLILTVPALLLTFYPKCNYRLNSCQCLFIRTPILQNPDWDCSHQFNCYWHHDCQQTSRLEQTFDRPNHV